LFAVENNLWFLLPTSWNGTYLSQVWLYLIYIYK
jgi:hypothetical protein